MAHQLTISLSVSTGQNGAMSLGVYRPDQEDYWSCYWCPDGNYCCSNPNCCWGAPFAAVQKGYVTLAIVLQDDGGVLIETLDHSTPKLLASPITGQLGFTEIAR